MTPADVARTLGVSVGTVRNWSATFGEFVSASARGEHGNRAYSPRDVEVLRYVHQLRAEGMAVRDIAQRLRETSIGDTETLVTPALAADTQEPTERARTSLEPSAAPTAPAVRDAALVLYNSLQQRLDALESTQQATSRAFMLGAVAGAVTVAAVVALVSVLVLVLR